MGDDERAGPGRSALTGAILALDAVGHCLALASFCFAGALSAGLGLATGAMLLSTLVMTLALLAASRFPVALGIAQDTSIALLAPAIAAAATMAVTGGPAAQVATGLAVMGTSALLSGLLFWGIGRLGLGRLVRLFPYPVAAGFLAASGAMLVTAGLFIVSGAHGWPGLLAHLATGSILMTVLPAVTLACLLMVALKKVRGSTGVLAVIMTAIAGFHAMLALTGTDLDAARTLGLLPQTGPAAGGLPGPVALLGLVDWTAVAWTVPTLAAVAVLSLIGVLLNTSGVELATGSTVEANRELRLTGLANLLIGLFGGLTSFVQAGASVMAHKLGVAARPLVAGQVAVLALAIVFAGQIVALVPVFVAAGLLIFIGLSMLDDWLVATRAHLMPADWRLVVGIVILTMVVGILPAMAAGLALAILGFAIGYARLPVIRRASDAAQRPSVVDRAPEDAATLLLEGRRIIILHLQGALFFGSIDQMATDIDRRITPQAGLRDIILDLSAIDAVDSAACAGLTKLVRSLASRAITLHLVHVAPEFVARFRRWGLPLTTDLAAPRTDLRLWPTLDDALEVCEEALLTAIAGPDRSVGMVSLLRDLGADDPRTADLLTVLEPVDLAAGAVLIAAGTRSGDVFVLESGRLGVHLPSPQGPGLRVRTMAPGALVGEMAHILGLPRSADVIALTAARVWRMPADRPAALAANDPGLAVLWATILARALAHKVAQTNRLVALPRDTRTREGQNP